MSSAPKGERIEGDRYYTDDAVALRLVRLLDITDRATIIEPSVGGGAFVRAIDRCAVLWSEIIACDIDPNASGLTHPLVSRVVGDFAAFTLADFQRSTGEVRADWVVGNPPYSHAEAHIRHALTLAPRCAFLLRLAFLESTKRVAFWRDHQPARVYVLAQRPSFTGGGTDSAAYGWFVWDADHKGATELHVLDGSGHLWGAR